MIKISNLVISGIFSGLLILPLEVKAQEHPLVGVSYPPLPEEVKERAGWSIKSPYVVDYVFYNGQRSLLLGRLLKRDSQGKGLYKVVNVLTLPPLSAETEEVTGGSSCTANGIKDPNFIMIMKSNDNTPYLTKARKAWWVEGETFKEVKVQGFQFKCENFSYGL